MKHKFEEDDFIQILINNKLSIQNKIAVIKK